jgi:DNA primase
LSLSTQFLDELRARTSLSALVGASVKLTKAGREHKGCCPFHNEKTASFYVNDDKGFYHCFGCSAHGDAIRWLTEQRGLGFIDAVGELAARAGMEVPAATPEYREREEKIAAAGNVIEAAAGWYATRLAGDAAALAMLAGRGVDAAAIARFGLGLAPATGGVAQCGASVQALTAAGLMVETANGWRERFRQRVMIPIHDHRGRVIGFGGRSTNDARVAAGEEPKYLNSAEGPHFDKGRTLYNLHRAAPAARAAKRLVIVEGYFDAIALDAVGVAEVVAPMGTALTEAQLIRAWRVDPCPILLLDGDGAGRRAAFKACERAMPGIGAMLPGSGQGCSLSIAILPDGRDPDDLARAEGREGVERVLSAAVPLSEFVFDAVVGVAA